MASSDAQQAPWGLLDTAHVQLVPQCTGTKQQALERAMLDAIEGCAPSVTAPRQRG